MFNAQVNGAAERGFTRIDAYAARSERYNGWYTWPRLGYDARLEHILVGHPELAKQMAQKFPDAVWISDVMETAEGRKFWLRDGVAFKCSFDLRSGSLSREILSDYVQIEGGTSS